MEDLFEYKCPCCGAELNFDSKSQQMLCKSCGNKFTAEQMSQLSKQDAESGKKSEYNWDEYECKNGEINTKTLICESCGAEIEAEETTAATECPYCGNPVVVKSSVSGLMTPDLIIPFKLDKKAAIAALEKHYTGKKLLPDCFRDKNHLEKVTGIYVPFWLFDCDTYSSLTYNATRRFTWSDSNYIYVKSDHFLISRDGEVSFDKIPVDASKKMLDNYMDALEPFDYKSAVPFLDAYMAGFCADKFDVASNESIGRANARVEESVKSLFASTVKGYATVIPRKASIKSTSGKINYALLPVWILTTKYGDKNYMFAVNGQTGKTVGELPVDKGKAWKYFGIAAGIAFAALNALMLLLTLL